MCKRIRLRILCSALNRHCRGVAIIVICTISIYCRCQTRNALDTHHTIYMHAFAVPQPPSIPFSRGAILSRTIFERIKNEANSIRIRTIKIRMRAALKWTQWIEIGWRDWPTTTWDWFLFLYFYFLFYFVFEHFIMVLLNFMVVASGKSAVIIYVFAHDSTDDERNSQPQWNRCTHNLNSEIACAFGSPCVCRVSRLMCRLRSIL